MIKILFNAIEMIFAETMTLQQVLDANGFNAGYFAIAINRQFIPRSAYANTHLNDGDQIDVVTPMQGG
jgi:sulfur carrier protein